MATTNYKSYDQGEVESIRMMLEAEAKEGKPLCFEVKVNGNTRIHKTDKVERFNDLYNFINENTKELIINIYPEVNNNRKEWYKYRFSDASENLNGVGDMEQKLNERMKSFEEKQATLRTEEKLKETQEELRQAEEYIDILEAKLEAKKIKPNHFGDWDLGKLGSSILEGVAIHHPKILENVPVLNGIAKVIQEDVKNKPQQLNGSFEGDVSFKAKEENKTPELTPYQKQILQLGEFIASHFETDQIRVLGLVIETLGEDTSKLQIVADLLNIKDAEETEEESETN